jgi:hypothetical protein
MVGAGGVDAFTAHGAAGGGGELNLPATFGAAMSADFRYLARLPLELARRMSGVMGASLLLSRWSASPTPEYCIALQRNARRHEAARLIPNIGRDSVASVRSSRNRVSFHLYGGNRLPSLAAVLDTLAARAVPGSQERRYDADPRSTNPSGSRNSNPLAVRKPRETRTGHVDEALSA